MTRTRLVLASLRHFSRAHLGTFLGAALGSAVLVGALAVGDSVRGSLEALSRDRLGNVVLALAGGDRFVRDELARELEDPLDAPTAAVVQVLGTVGTADGSARANRVQVLGVDGMFWALAPEGPPFTSIEADAVVLNSALAVQLNAKVGDTLVLRVPKPSELSRDAPLSPAEDTAVALRVRVQAVVTDKQFGRFGLHASQAAPMTAFLDRGALQKRLEVEGRSNLVLVGGGTFADATAAGLALPRVWQASDAQIEVRALDGGRMLEVRSPRVFLEAPVVEAIGKAAPGSGGRLLTYFVNELSAGAGSTPYSMVTAAEAPWVPEGMADDEMILHDWLASDLGARVGDTVTMRFYVVGLGRALEERTNSFRVRAVIPMSGATADPSLMPDFPGLTDADNCRDWDTGFPIDTDRIREKDEKYWDDHKGTPKAFISLAAGRRLWGNRFGDLTAIRVEAGAVGGGTEEFGKRILGQLPPASVGLTFDPVRQRAAAGVAESQDFGGLFIGFSFFLIGAALMLMVLLFQLGLEQRNQETGLLLALGFTPASVKRLWLGESFGLALLGALAGLAGGVLYARLMLQGLSTVWQEAVGTSALGYYARPGTLALGVAVSLATTWGTLWVGLRRQARRSALELLSQGSEERLLSGEEEAAGGRRSGWIAVGCFVAGAGLAVAGLFASEPSPGGFFGAGALLLASGLAATAWWLGRLRRADSAAAVGAIGLSWGNLAIRNCTRRPRRSLATISLLASGSFLVASIGVFRLDSARDADRRGSGTGGFAFWGESSLPVIQDLNNAEGRGFYGLDGAEYGEVQFVPMRVRDGEEASCLNLNRAQKPRLLGVRPQLLAERGSFTFARVQDGDGAGNPWELLSRSLPDGAIPAIGDAASIQWAMGLKVGGSVEFEDERGRKFAIRIVGAVANSILQGNLLIDERAFVEKFPGESGYRMFLVDSPAVGREQVGAGLSRMFRDVGLELTPASRRLAAFNAVQNTYLGTFQLLGGLGLLLGSIGLGVLVMRNVLERRGELAVMLAIGFSRAMLRRGLTSEHGMLLGVGLLAGAVAAAIAVMPVVLTPGSVFPWQSLGFTLAGIVLNGLAWTVGAAATAMRGELAEGLRGD